MGTSLLSRKCDLAYFIHFSIALPMMFLVDLQAIYPPSLVPTFAKDVKSYYINTYKDDFFVNTPPFFKMFMWSEILYQAPVMLWALGGLWNHSPKVPLVLLPFAVVIFVTTLTCVTEYAFWDVPLQQKVALTTLYGPYLALSAFMGGDMYFRLNSMINSTIKPMTIKIKKSQ